MKKFLIFLVLVAAGYFAYDYFFAEKIYYEINASYNKQRESVSIEGPAINPRDFAHYEGRIKNISDKTLNNVVITYMIDAQSSDVTIGKLEPGEVKEFRSSDVMLQHMDPSHYLKEVTFDPE